MTMFLAVAAPDCFRCHSNKDPRGGAYFYASRFICGKCIAVIAIQKSLWRYDEKTRNEMLSNIVHDLMVKSRQ